MLAVGDDFGVDLFDAGEGVVNVVFGDDFETLFAHGFLEGGLGKDFEDGAGDCSDVAGFGEEAVLFVFD